MLQNISLKKRLLLITLIAIITMLVSSGIQMWHIKTQLLEDRKATLTASVDLALSVVKVLNQQVEKGKLSQQEAQTQAKTVLRGLRYLGEEYFYVYDSKALGIMHPIRPEYEGKSHWDRQDKSGRYTVRELVKTAQDKTHPYTETLTPKPGKEEQVPKLHRLEHFQPWDWVIGTGLYIDDLDGIFRRELLKALVGLLSSLLLVSGVSWAIAKSILNQMGGEPRHVATLMQQVSEGHLEMQATQSPPNSMMAMLHGMVSGLRGMVKGVSEGARTLINSAVTISDTANQVADASQNQLKATLSMATAVEEMSCSITHIAQSANETEKDSILATKTVAEGEKAVARATQEISKIADSVSHAAEIIRQLEARANEISQVTGVISEIAAQTNLLALNAAIEAARAGEQGRGFAVVADEVRSLASRTATATLQIGEMVASIQQNTGTAVTAMDAVLPQVQQGVDLIECTATSLQAISQRTHSTLERIQGMARTTQEQNAASASIAKQVTYISNMLEGTSQSMIQVANSAKTARQVATDLNQLIARFRY